MRGSVYPEEKKKGSAAGKTSRQREAFQSGGQALEEDAFEVTFIDVKQGDSALITSAADLGTVPAELIGCFNLIFYSSAEDAVFKALGAE